MDLLKGLWFRDSCESSHIADMVARAIHVIDEVKNWMTSKSLCLNDDKTNFIWLGTSHFFGKRDIPAIDGWYQLML